MLENLIFYQSFRLSELAVSNSECSQTKVFKSLSIFIFMCAVSCFLLLN